MTTEQVKENIEDGIVRLRRQYEICFRGYDRPAFKDLAHILRVWVDMRKEVDFYLRINRPATKFMSYGINARLNRYYIEKPYFVVAFPVGVFISGSDIHPGFSDNSSPTGPGAGLHVDTTDKTIFSAFDYQRTDYPDKESVHRVRYVLVVHAGYNEDLSTPKLENVASIFDYQKVSFGSWLDSLALRIKGVNKYAKSFHIINITREVLIKRVANSLGASHPVGGFAMSDINDPIIKRLMRFTIHKLPIPYVILLKIVQDILSAFK